MSPLTLTRKEGEVVTVNGNIEVSVQRARHGKATLEVDAPLDMRISRSRERTPAREQEAAESDLSPMMQKMLGKWE